MKKIFHSLLCGVFAVNNILGENDMEIMTELLNNE